MTTKFFRSLEEPIGTHVAVSCDLAGRQYAVVDGDGYAISLHGTLTEAQAEARAEQDAARRDGHSTLARALTLTIG